MSARGSDAPSGPPLLLSVFLVALSVLVMVAFETLLLVRSHQGLLSLRASQEPSIQEATKMRQQLETVAGKAAQLAAEGDAAARGVVDELRRQGVNLSVPKP